MSKLAIPAPVEIVKALEMFLLGFIVKHEM